MSAIITIFNQTGDPIAREFIEPMLQANPERSVDGEDIWINRFIALAHQHFWIAPEDYNERQPIIDDLCGSAITCDARLDNRAELLTLLNLPDRFDINISDASLILDAYRHWGTACVNYIQGDFAFIIWDAREQHLFAARDALGSRNLCYSLTGGCLILASEISQILAAPGLSFSINHEKIAEYLSNYYLGESQSYYNNIYYLPPAHTLLATQTSLRLTRFWDFQLSSSLNYKDEREYEDHFRELLNKTISCRMRMKGKIGVSMSGGLDSTSLTALAWRILEQEKKDQRNLAVFSYRFNELIDCDEGKYIQAMLDRFPVESYPVYCDDLWPLKNLAEWPVDPGYVLSDAYALLPEAIMLTAQEAGCRVLLAGYFGDVLFEGGYYWIAENLYKPNLPHFINVMRSSSSYALQYPRIDWRIDVLNFGLRPLIPFAFKRFYRQYRPRQAVHLGLTAGLFKTGNIEEKILARGSPAGSNIPGRRARLQSFSLNTFTQGAAATRKRYNRRGIELETPFWDRRLLEFFLAVPADLLYRSGVDRYLFRQTMIGVLPESVRTRTQKTIFLPLIEKGLIIKEHETVCNLLTDPLVVQMGFIRADWLQSKLNNPNGWVDYGTELWPSICLELWLRLITKTSLPIMQ